MNNEHKSGLPKGYVSTSDLPQSIAAKLRTGDQTIGNLVGLGVTKRTAANGQYGL